MNSDPVITLSEKLKALHILSHDSLYDAWNTHKDAKFDPTIDSDISEQGDENESYETGGDNASITSIKSRGSTSPRDSKGRLTFQSAKPPLKRWLREAGIYACHVTGENFTGGLSYHFAHILAPRSMQKSRRIVRLTPLTCFDDSNPSQLNRIEKLLGVTEPKGFSLHSRLFLMPRKPSIPHSSVMLIGS